MSNISVLIKPASGNCNMHCDYCFYCDEMEKRKQASFGFMSEETLKNNIKRTLLRADGTASFAFQGGEPTLRGIEFYKKAVAFEKKYNRKNNQIINAFQTNGVLIDEKWCRFFKENDFLVGISVDGIKAVHDKNRHMKSGESSFERIEKSISLLEEYRVDFNILTVVHRDTATQIDEIYRYYRDHGWRYQQYIACLDPLDEEHGKGKFALSAEEYSRFMIKLFNLWYRDYKRGKQPYIRQFDNYIMMLMGYPPESCDQNGVCSIQYVSEADGSIYPCDFYVLDEYRLGNINEDRLPRLDQERKRIGFIERSMRIDDECKICPYYGLCRNGCHRMRDYDAVKGTWKNYLCEGYRAFFEACLPKLQEMADCKLEMMRRQSSDEKSKMRRN